MLAVETPQSAFRKRSIFRRFTRRDKEATSPATPTFNDPSRNASSAPRKLQKRTSSEASAYLPNAPPSPKRHILPDPQPTKPQAPKMITHIQRIEIPPKYEPVRDLPQHNASQNLPLRVLPTAMPKTPFNGAVSIRAWDVFLTPEKIFQLYLGFLPKDMSDRWFIYSEGPDQSGKLKVHFHRSWTGLKIAELFIVIDTKGEGAGKIVGLKWNGDETLNRMNEEEAKYMIRTTCRWSLNVDLEAD